MGLYESELNKQLYLRNQQKQEWDVMKKEMEKKQEKNDADLSHKKNLFEKQQRDQDREELKETEISKNLSNAMVKSAREQSDETLQKVVDVLQNQNGKGSIPTKFSKHFRYFFFFSTHHHHKTRLKAFGECLEITNRER